MTAAILYELLFENDVTVKGHVCFLRLSPRGFVSVRVLFRRPQTETVFVVNFLDSPPNAINSIYRSALIP